jgi:hypothetical protein
MYHQVVEDLRNDHDRKARGLGEVLHHLCLCGGVR